MHKIKAIAHICIKAKDLAKTSHFYCKVLGFEKVFDFTKTGEVKGCYLKVNNNNFIEVFEDKETEARPSNISHICLETDNVQELKELLSEKKIATSDIKLGPDNTYQFWVKDPNGIDIEFHAYTSESSQITKKNVEMDW